MNNKYIYLILIFIIAIFFNSCKEENIVVSNPCNEGPSLEYDSVSLHIATSIFSDNIISIYKNGAIGGSNIKVQNGNFVKSASISGVICKDLNYTVNIFYTDTTDNSKLKIEGRLVSPYYATLYYCPNVNNNCNYVAIGNIIATYFNTFSGSFTSPLFSGTFTIDPMK